MSEHNSATPEGQDKGQKYIEEHKEFLALFDVQMNALANAMSLMPAELQTHKAAQVMASVMLRGHCASCTHAIANTIIATAYRCLHEAEAEMERIREAQIKALRDPAGPPYKAPDGTPFN